MLIFVWSNALIKNRLLSLDVFRGLTIMLMILVNSVPINYLAYPLLEHAQWNGFTLADWVFPSFLFIIGVTIVISLSKRTQPNGELYKAILKRSLLLFLIGLLLNAIPNHLNLVDLRFYGVLQRIAICYCLGAFLYLTTSLRVEIVLFAVILIAYYWVVNCIPLPGMSIVELSLEGNWAAYIDRLLFSSNHLYGKTYDPEGFLSTFPALSTTLFGVIIGRLLVSKWDKYKQLYCMLCIGVAAMVLGWLWSYSFPLNKNIWTSSYVLWSGGSALLVFAACFYSIDILGYTKWTLPFKIFGVNALFAFILHVLLLKMQFKVLIPLNTGERVPFSNYLISHVFPGCSQEIASLGFALLFVGFNFIVLAILYKRKIFIRL